jgi:hypothetical protein
VAILHIAIVPPPFRRLRRGGKSATGGPHMATYREAQEHVRKHEGFVPQTCWIAHVLSDHGRTRGVAPNRHDPAVRVKPCPAHRRQAIERSLRALEML